MNKIIFEENKKKGFVAGSFSQHAGNVVKTSSYP